MDHQVLESEVFSYLATREVASLEEFIDQVCQRGFHETVAGELLAVWSSRRWVDLVDHQNREAPLQIRLTEQAYSDSTWFVRVT